MNKDEMRIKIAEACGWTECVFVESIELAKGFPPLNNPPSYGTYENGMAQLPDYLNDLNAMHEAEKFLTNEQWSVYLPKLWGVISHQRPATYECHATATQRADAFLRTINKWTTNPN